MKIFVVLLALAACVYADQWSAKNAEEFSKIRSDCLQASGISDEEKGKIKNFEFSNEEPVRKYLHCTAEKIGLYSDNDGYHAERVAKQFKTDLEVDMDEAEAKKLVEECIAKHPKADKANDVVVYETYKCFLSTVIGDRVKDYVKKRNQAQ